MGIQVVAGATTLCSFGTAPSSLIIFPKGVPVLASTLPAGTIMDYIPYANILPFAMCVSLANPAVASATTAASGVLTPQPCVPTTAAPWIVGAPTVLINNFPALNESAKCMCAFGGVISITAPGQATVSIP